MGLGGGESILAGHFNAIPGKGGGGWGCRCRANLPPSAMSSLFGGTDGGRICSRQKKVPRNFWVKCREEGRGGHPMQFQEALRVRGPHKSANFLNVWGRP